VSRTTKAKSVDYGLSLDGTWIGDSGGRTGIVLGAKLSPGYIRSNVYVDANDNRTKRELKIPYFYTYGAAVLLSESFTVTVDYRSHNWSDSESRNEVNGAWTDWADYTNNDLNAWHFGMEKLNLTTGASFRLGYYNKPYVDDDANGNQIVNKVFTIGMGFAKKNFSLDFSSQFELH